jgi:hypothetical protein
MVQELATYLWWDVDRDLVEVALHAREIEILHEPLPVLVRVRVQSWHVSQCRRKLGVRRSHGRPRRHLQERR